MPAINALLPIVAASNSQKQSTQSQSDESRVSAVKDAANAVEKGLERDAAAEKRMQQKRFINVYEEGIQEQGRQQERRAERVAERELAQQDDVAALAASGSPLPPEGETLPTPGVPSASDTNAQSDRDDANKPLRGQAPSTPSVSLTQELSTTELAVDLPSYDTNTLNVKPQQQAAEDFHALVKAQNGKADEKQQGILSVASLQAQEADSALANDSALGLAAKQASADALAGVQQTGTTGDENLAIQQQTPQSSATLATTLTDNETARQGDQPEQAQLVRAWRGIDAQELRSASSLTSQATTQATVQASRQDPVAASIPISLSGQIQQFAQSLRLASAQPDAVVSSATGDRIASSTPQSSAELSPWRADSASVSTPSAAGRATVASTPFAQSMQASNFGQPLGEAVGQNAWGERIAQRVTLMAGLKVSSAQIQLDPPELGAMTVKINVNGDQASVSFHSPHAVVRDALEFSFPRLQEMMGQQGMQLVNAQVSDNSSARQGSGESSSGGAGQSSGETQEEGLAGSMPQIVQVATGLIDFYA